MGIVTSVFVFCWTSLIILVPFLSLPHVSPMLSFQLRLFPLLPYALPPFFQVQKCNGYPCQESHDQSWLSQDASWRYPQSGSVWSEVGISHFGSANITTQTAILQIGSPRRSPRFMNKYENPKIQQNSYCTIFQHFVFTSFSSSFASIHKLRFWWDHLAERQISINQILIVFI